MNISLNSLVKSKYNQISLLHTTKGIKKDLFSPESFRNQTVFLLFFKTLLGIYKSDSFFNSDCT